MGPLLYVKDFAKHKNKVMQRHSPFLKWFTDGSCIWNRDVRKMNKKDIIETWEQMVALCVKKQIETHFGLNSDVDSGEPKKRAITA